MFVFSSISLCIWSWCDEGVFQACPCTSHHKGVWTFVFPLSLCVRLVCSSFHVCRLFTRAVRSKARWVVVIIRHWLHKKGQWALAQQVVFVDRQTLGILHPFLLPSLRPPWSCPNNTHVRNFVTTFHPKKRSWELWYIMNCKKYIVLFCFTSCCRFYDNLSNDNDTTGDNWIKL